ncbi:hypothetical protein ONR57_09925 [Hoyosella sp. YIM 151337]|uniref:hypothetical protein n=1 Tax=Hoyosella sp. YIM 151337 TaxID=2992742 RepID=UPI002235F1A8|nr:hypothetical protein [Hoyosella sp. YIM 151337]MCW4353611.1 hypothetical protein [Hoyosella sp. YIM 151337]
MSERSPSAPFGNAAYLLIGAAVVAIALAIVAAAGGVTGGAVAAAIAGVVLLVLGGVLWRKNAARKAEALPDTHDRQTSTEGRGPLDA